MLPAEKGKHAKALHAIPSRCAQLVAPDNLESKFAALEGSNVDDELSKMKAQLGVGKKPIGQASGRAMWA